jgi:Ca2+-binding EF-hand superfamily protein
MYRLLLAALACAAVLAAPPASGAPPAPDGAQDFVYLGDARPILVRMYVEINDRPLQAIWDEFVTGLFKDADTNGDGVLSREEAGRLPPPQALFGGGGPPFLLKPGGAAGNELFMPFAQLDANKDGKVTRDELARFYRANGFTPIQFRGNGNQMVGRRFVRLVGQAEPMTAEAINKVLFDLLDANKDGKLSRQELAAGPARLAKLDINDDEMIDVGELNPNAILDDGLAGAAVAFVVDASALPNNEDFVAVAPGEASKDLARRLLAKYGPKSKGSGSQKLTRDALGLDEATFAALDVDGDGALDSEELARFAGRPADLKLMARLGKKPAVELLPEQGRPTALADKVRTGWGGTLGLDLGATRIDLAIGGNTFAGRFDLRSQYLAEFRRADRDDNGYLDRDEANRSPLFRNLFKLIDRDGDGKIFEKEVIAYLEKTERLQESAADCCVSLAASPAGNGLFDLLDGNRDRRLSVRELRQMTKLIEQLDRDGDGCVGRDEIPRAFRLTVEKGPADNGGFSGNVVLVASGAMTMDGPPPPEPTAGPLWFRKMDRNRDGDVSRREFLGTDEEFRRIDADGDGLISAAEAARADELFRKGKQRKP